MSVYLFPSVCAWSVCARVLQWNGVCAFRRMCECECDMSILLVSLLHVAVRWLAGWLAWQKMTNQSSEKMRLSWHQSGTNLRINCSRVDKHMHTHTEEHLEPHRSTCGWLLFVCVFVHRPALLQRCVIYLFIFFSVRKAFFSSYRLYCVLQWFIPKA